MPEIISEIFRRVLEKKKKRIRLRADGKICFFLVCVSLKGENNVMQQWVIDYTPTVMKIGFEDFIGDCW